GTIPVETANLSGQSQIIIGLKGNSPRVKMEIEDAWGNKQAAYLEGIEPDVEKIWAVPTAYFKNIDFTKTRFIMFIIEGENISGQLIVRSVQDAHAMLDRTTKDGLAAAAIAGAFWGYHRKPDDLDILGLANRIRSAALEVFVPASQMPKNTVAKFRHLTKNIFNARLSVYSDIEHLKNIIKNPGRSIVMTVDLTEDDISSLRGIEGLGRIRFMNFERVDAASMESRELENYLAEMISVLLVARIIERKDAEDRSSPIYRMLACMLEKYLSPTNDMDSYILNIADDNVSPITRLRYIITTILRALPIAVYKTIHPAVSVLWSA
ncbi:MAG: hypothetical protein NC933_05120, partial [Candidatus Omnitrophica bacterium]|nr:hypothetical protein [Candidatus Omnitrophota bacterium]